jgi:DNA-directed RNA polymerase specialized sigma24 family protein
MMVELARQLEELLRDPGYRRTIAALTWEVSTKWRQSRAEARRLVLSAIGEPTALAVIHAAWIAGKTGASPKLAAVISRRRVIDLLSRDARRAGHVSLPTTADDLDGGGPLDVAETLAHDDPHAQLECKELIQMVRGAIACFAAGSSVRQKQARLLERRILEGASYAQLSMELVCNENALRVRVHVALKALQRHILECHPALLPARLVLPPGWTV